MPLAEVERKLTRRALMVWGAYAAYRDKDGSCWPSRGRIVEVVEDFFGAEITPSDVQVALRRLRRLGLVENIKWLPLKRYRKVYYRMIHGRVILRGREWFVSVPDKVERAMSKANTRGGARSGAGRPGLIKSPDALCHPTASTGPGANQKSPDVSSPLPPLPPLPPSRCLASQDSDDRSAVVVSSKEGAEADLLSSLGFLPPDSPVYSGLQYTPGELGIPLRPSEALGRQAVVPAARPFTERELVDDGRVLYRMRQALEGALRAVAGRRPSTFVRSMAPGTKRDLLELARRLTEIGASPESWFLFSANRWHGERMMPVRYALSTRRLTEQRGWFRSVRRSYARSRVLTVATERELNKRHSIMLALLWHHQPQTLDGVRAIVDRCFPGNSWDRLIAQARREIDAERARIDRKIADGEFVWDK